MARDRHGTGPGTRGIAAALAGGVLLAVAGVRLWLNERGDGPDRAGAPTTTSTAAQDGLEGTPPCELPGA